jgi:hypothetical protein
MDGALIGNSYWANKLHKFKTDVKTCKRCRQRYTEASNIGRWQCSQHAVHFVPQTGTIWPCCKQKVTNFNSPVKKGCVPADHSTFEAPYDEEHNIPVPLILATQLGLKPTMPSIVKPDDPSNTEVYETEEDKKEADNYLVVRRYNKKIADEKGYADILPVYSAPHY